VAEQVYRYFTSTANTGQQEPPVSLALTPHLIQGHDGQTVGWLTLRTNTTDHKTNLALTGDVPSGVRLVDAHGAQARTGADGERFGVRVPAGLRSGHVTVTAQGATTITAGRVFVGDAGPAHTQTLILAKSETVTAAAHAVAAWTSTPHAPGTPSAPSTPTPPVTAAGALAHTGTDDTPLLIGTGLALVALGSTLVFFLRRKNRPSTDTSKN
jgi:LPXTG-motif cell wall-anchored protein